MMPLLWLPHRSPHHGRSLVPASTALERYRSSASTRLPLDGPRAHHAAGDSDHQDGHQDSERSSHHTASMAAVPGSDHPYGVIS